MKDRLLLLHGALGDSSQFDQLVELLDDHFEVFVPDLPGHGSLSGEAFDMQVLRTFIGDYYKNTIKGNAHVFGYSMGGYAALVYGAMDRSYVKSIMTLGTKFDWTPEYALKESAMLDYQTIIQKVPKFAELLKMRHGNDNWIAVLDETRNMMMDLGQNQYLDHMNLADFDFPVMISRGSLDSLVTDEETINMANRINKGNYHIHDGLKHPFEQVNCDYIGTFILNFTHNANK